MSTQEARGRGPVPGPSLPAGPLAQPVVSLGNSWTAANVLSSQVHAIYVRTGSNALHSGDSLNDSPDLIEVALGAPATAVGVCVYSVNTIVRLEAFDAADASLGFIDWGGHLGYAFLGITTTTDIASVRIFAQLSRPNDDFAIDDFVFGDALNVPVPPTGVLLTAGLAALGIRRRALARAWSPTAPSHSSMRSDPAGAGAREMARKGSPNDGLEAAFDASRSPFRRPVPDPVARLRSL